MDRLLQPAFPATIPPEARCFQVEGRYQGSPLMNQGDIRPRNLQQNIAEHEGAGDRDSPDQTSSQRTWNTVPSAKEV